jgi:hypothetical protein
MVKRTKEIMFVIFVLLSVVAAWLAGRFRHNASVSAVLQTVMPEAHHFEKAPDNVYIGLIGDGNEVQPVGYVGLCSETGRLGPIELAAGFDNTGLITSLALVQPLRDPHVSPKVLNTALSAFIGRHYNDPPQQGQMADLAPALQGFWQSLTDLVNRIGGNVSEVRGEVVAEGYQRRRWFGFPELVLILLYAVGYLAYRERLPYHRFLHWGSLAGGVVFIGFWLNSPMSLEHINSFLMGYWPSWQTHLYWYLLIGGVLLPIILSGRSFYCSHVCPFGATQSLLKVIGHKRITLPDRVDAVLRWLQRTLVWLAVICALLLRNPAVVRYEVSQTLFGQMAGVTWQFVLLAVVLIASLVITKPWCNYLCPIRAITDFVNLVRRVVGLETAAAKTAAGCTLEACHS